jgi:glutathione S-transferase
MTFYDIAMAPPRHRTACSPNPWKSRLALNLKRADYHTVWVPLPLIATMRKSLHIPAGRQFADGADFYTLPILDDNGTLVGDSFDIALHLAPLPGPALFPPIPLDYKLPADLPLLVPLSDVSGRPEPAYAAFNMAVDAAFTAHTGLCTFGFPFDPATKAQTQAEFVRRASVAGITKWEQFALSPEARESTLVSLEKTLGGLAEVYARTQGDFINGAEACYADCIVGGWLMMLRGTLPAEEWERVRGWHEGTFGRLFDALEPYRAVDEGTDWSA